MSPIRPPPLTWGLHYRPWSGPGFGVATGCHEVKRSATRYGLWVAWPTLSTSPACLLDGSRAICGQHPKRAITSSLRDPAAGLQKGRLGHPGSHGGERDRLRSWFGELGLPVLALSGFASQNYVDSVAADVAADARPAVLHLRRRLRPFG